MRRRLIRFLAITWLSMLLAAACGGAGSQGGTEIDSDRREPQRSVKVSAKDFDPANFDDSADVHNKWLPLKPGMQAIYEGHANEGRKRLSRRVVFTVTDLTKVINGVRTIVVWDRDYNSGRLVETELAFHAQDKDGNVWNLGEYPEEYEDGKLDKAPAWIAGLKGARPGLAMKAEPRLETPGYSQGYAPPPINWVDRARVYRVGQDTCVPHGCYENVLVTEEFERNKPGAYQLKFYAPGVGNVRVGWRGAKEEERETLALVDLVHLSPAALSKVREEALQLEKRAYEISKDVYGRTPPSKPLRPEGP